MTTETDSFLEPRTIPKKWDVSAFDSHPKPSKNGNSDELAEALDLQETHHSEDSGTGAVLEPFPQPRTVPGKWDVSNL